MNRTWIGAWGHDILTIAETWLQVTTGRSLLQAFNVSEMVEREGKEMEELLLIRETVTAATERTYWRIRLLRRHW